MFQLVGQISSEFCAVLIPELSLFFFFCFGQTFGFGFAGEFVDSLNQMLFQENHSFLKNRKKTATAEPSLSLRLNQIMGELGD